jgi:hypothetical protein
MNLEAQLRSYGDEVERRALDHDAPAGRGGAVPATDAVVPVGPRSRRPRRPALVAAAALVAVVVGLAAILVATRSETDVAGVDTGPAIETEDVVAPDAGDEPAPEPDPDAPPAEPDAPVSLWLSATRVPEGAVDLVAVLVDHAGAPVSYGVEAAIERWSGAAWEPYGRIATCLDHWYCSAPVARPGDPFGVQDIGMGAEPGGTGGAERFSTAGLPLGWYRLSHTVDSGAVATGVFEVAAGAPAPPPLVPMDAPSISVRPVLVPPTGTAAQITPLVPPVGGGSSRSAVEEAIAGLAEEAQIERWDGNGWTPVTDVALGPSEWDPTLARSLTIPPLPDGAYRLVRSGPAGEHTGRFWVVDRGERQHP